MQDTNLLIKWFSDERMLAYMPDSLWAQVILGLLVLVLLMVLASWLTSTVVTTIARRMLVATGHEDWSMSLWRRRVFRNVSYAVPLLVVVGNIGLLPIEDKYTNFGARIFLSIGLVFLFMAVSGVLSAWQDVYASSTRAQTRSIKGYLEIAKMVIWAVCVISVISIMIDRSPLLMLSGLGALSAVLLLVFKDTLLSLVASTQMTHNDMLRIGDWIEMPQAGADGFVVDIALHTVKVENWDKTVSTIPTYKLFSESYRNWRNMFESGGRRIKRTLRVDASTIRFLEEQEIADLGRYALLKDYLSSKQHELQLSNRALGPLAVMAGNRRRLTNIGTFRAYALGFLRQHKELRQDMVMIVRMMEPDSQGVPVEVYCFTDKTAWVDYERIQGDIFDHLLAILPEMSLRLYQAPSGADFSLSWGKREAAMNAPDNPLQARPG